MDVLIHRDNSDSLEHHGILGMHWGIRRFQNPDGSLTPAGERRYRSGSDVNDKGETRDNVRARLNKDGKKYEKMSKTYYEKSELKRLDDDFRNNKSVGGTFKRAAYSLEYDENKKENQWDYDVDRGARKYIDDMKKYGKYDESKDTNLKKSNTYENKSISAYKDARRLGQNYQRNKAITGAILGGLSGAAIGMFMGPNRNKSVEANLTDTLIAGLSGAAIGAISGKKYGKHQQERTEEKYGFKHKDHISADSGSVVAKTNLAYINSKAKSDKIVRSMQNTIDKNSNFLNAYSQTGVLAVAKDGTVYAIDAEGNQYEPAKSKRK